MGAISLLLSSKVMEFCGRLLCAPRRFTKLHPCSKAAGSMYAGLVASVCP